MMIIAPIALILVAENLGHINNRIIGTCFNDLNNDGMQQEAIEDGMVNVVLSFDKQGGTPHKGITITDTAGKFMFPALITSPFFNW